MRGALISASPPVRIASATSPVGAARTASHVGKRSRSDRNARSVFLSDVCCDSTVMISSSSGGRPRRQRRGPYAAFSLGSTHRSRSSAH